MAVCICAWVGAGTTGIISGVVKSAEDASPLSGVNVIVTGTTLSTVTDANGSFVITNVPPGEYEVRMEMVGFAVQTVKGVQVAMDDKAALDISMMQEAIKEETVVVTRPRPMVTADMPHTLNLLSAQQETMTRSDPTNFRAAAGVLGSLPGIITETDGSGQIHVRGGRPDQAGWYIEGIPITDPNTGMFGTDLFTTGVSKFQTYTGGFGAEYGNAISGVLNEVKKTGADTPGIRLNIEGGSDAYSDAFAEIGGGSQERFNYYIGSAVQRTSLDAPMVKDLEYSDNTAKLVWPSKNDTVTLLALQGSVFGKLQGYHDTGDNGAATPHEHDFMRQHYDVAAVTWSHNFSPSSFLTIRPYYLYTGILQNTMGGSNYLSGPQYIDMSSARRGLQVGYTGQLGERHLLKIGGSMLKSDNNDYIYVGFPLLTSNVNTSQNDIYAEDKVKLTDKLSATAGIRHESMTYDRLGQDYVFGAGYTGSNLGSVSASSTTPRFGLAFSANPRTVWKLSWGKYTKFVPASSVQSVYFFPDMGMADPSSAPDPTTNPSLAKLMPGIGAVDPQRNTAMELSWERQLSDSTAIRLTPFSSKYSNLGDTYADPTTGVSRYTNIGDGKTTGMECLFRKKMSNNWQGWLSYTYQKAKANRADLGLVGDMYYTSWDQTHTVSLVTDYKGKHYSHNVRADFGSGRMDVGAPALQQRANPSFMVSYGLTMDLPKGSRMGDSLYLNVFNIFNNHQTLQYRWGTDGAGNPVRNRDSWVASRFISMGVSSSF